MSIKKDLYRIGILCLCFIFSIPAPAFAWQGVVISVHDGDSVRVRRDDGVVVPIRIYGVDCPELDQPGGVEARDVTIKLVLGQRVNIIPVGQRPSYGREVAGVVLLDGLTVLQEALVSSGLAWVDERYCKVEACRFWRRHQADAAAATPPRGLWADPAPVPPWQWRRMHRK